MLLFDFASNYGIDDCAFHGVRKEGQVEYGCGRLWKQYKREQFLEAVQRAMQKMEAYMGIPLGRKYVKDEQVKWNWKSGLVGPLKWGHIQTIGVETETAIQSNVALTLSALGSPIDPVVITVGTTVTEPGEIEVRHVAAKGGSVIEPLTTKIATRHGTILQPSISISGGVATIRIPRCHLVDPTLEQPETGFDYTQDSNFVTSVNVYRVYVDTTAGVSLVSRPGGCSTSLCANDVTEACGVLQNSETGLVLVRPAAHTGSAWVNRCIAGSVPIYAQVSYVAGYHEKASLLYDSVPMALQTAIIKLAHTEMPQPACECSLHEESWALDRKQCESFLAWDVLRNPFGTLNGQIYAYNALKLFMTGQAGTI
jgi:hypothetical protein